MMTAIMMPMKLWAEDSTAEPYAVLNEDNTVLTFYYDDQKAARNGMSVGPFTQDGGSRDWASNSSTITTAVFDASFANCTTLSSTAYWFYQCKKLTTIEGISNLKTDNVTDMENMFWDCPELTGLDVSGFNTAKVTNMSGMFGFCNALTSLDVSGFNTQSATDMSYMFYQCKNVPELNVSPFKTEQVTNMSYMFYECSALTALDVSGFSTSDVTNMEYMFSDCTNLEMLDLSSFNTANVTQMRAMFRDCSQLKLIYAGSGWTTAAIVNNTGNNMFYGCTNLVGGNGTTYNANNVGYTYARIDGGTSNPGYFTDKNAPIELAQDTDGYYQIGTAAEWKAFADMALTKPTANARMTADIDLGDDQTMIGTMDAEDAFYQGHFDGQGHTLTVNFIADMNVAPFRYVKGATIDRLHVTGRMEANGTCGVGGVVAKVNEGAVTTIRRCWSSALLVSNTSGSAQNTIGGIVSSAYGPTVIEDCLFDGEFGPDNRAYNAGILANPYNEGSVIRNTLNIGNYPSNDPAWSSTFFRTDDALFHEIQLDNVYYLNVCGTAQGTQVTAEQLADGTVLALLQNGRSKDVWLQGDATPILSFAEILSEPEAYAVLSDNSDDISTDAATGEVIYGKTLTFYYDGQKTARGGMDVKRFDWLEDRGWNADAGNITKVVFDNSFANNTSLTSTSSWFSNLVNLTEIQGIGNLKTQNVTSMSGMFTSCSKLTSLDLSGFNTSNVVNMQGMFRGCSSLTSVDVSHFNTSNVVNMYGMFAECPVLTRVDVSGFNTENVTDMSLLFYECNAITSLDVSGFNTANVTEMYSMFRRCLSLQSIDVSHFNTEKVTDMHEMFAACTALENLDLSSFNTANVESMYYMFNAARSLKELDLSSFDMSKVKNMEGMFAFCESLERITVERNWDISSVTSGSSVFVACRNLKGGMGTTYDANHVDHTYARIDGGAAAPGYFTPKNGYPTVAALEFSHVGNNVYIHTETENATIYYTLNGETPDATSNVYKDSIMVRRNGTIKAIAMKDYYLPSEVATFTVDWFEVPPVDIVYDGRYFSIEADATAQVNYSINDGNVVQYTGGKIEVPGLCTIHVTAEVEGMNTAEADFSVNSYFDGKTAQVRDGGSFSEAFQWCGTNAALNDVTAILWNKSTAMSNSDMQGIENPNLLLYVSNKALAPGNVKNIVVGDSLSGYKAQQIVLTDTETGNGNFFCPIAFTASRITYEREFLQYTEPDSCRGWETLVLPFAPQSIMHERNGVLRPFAAEGEGRPFWLREFSSNGFVEAKQIEANKPYVIAMPNHVAYDMEYRLGGWVTFSAYGCNVPQTNLQTATDSTGTIRFIPALSTEMQQDSVYALNVGEEYLVNNKKYAEGSIFVAGWSDVRPFHCYTQHTASSPAPRYMPLSRWLDGDVTGISEKVIVNSDEFATAPVYNLKGQRVTQPTKGIYIMNGKKVKK